MKKLSILACLLAFSTVAGASDICTINKDPGEVPGQNYTLRVYSVDGSEIVYYDEVKSNLDTGKLEFSFEFGQTSGSYPYIIRSESGLEIKDTLDYIDPDEYTNAFAQLSADSKAGDVAAVKADLFEKYVNIFQVAKGFSVDSNILAIGDITSAINGMITDINQTLSPTIDTVQNIYRKNMLLFAIEKGNNELIANAVSGYGSDLGLTDEVVNKYYDAMTTKAKQNTASIERGKYSTTADFASAHATAVALGAINSASQYVEIGTILNDLGAKAGLSSIDSYSGSQRTAILQGLAKYSPFVSKDDFEAKLKKAIDASKSTSTSTPTKSTGGGGGGGGSVSVTTTSDDTLQDKPTQYATYLTAPFTIKDKATVIAMIKALIK